MSDRFEQFSAVGVPSRRASQSTHARKCKTAAATRPNLHPSRPLVEICLQLQLPRWKSQGRHSTLAFPKLEGLPRCKIRVEFRDANGRDVRIKAPVNASG